MALERVLAIEERFSDLLFLHNVRRDPEWEKQLYLLGVTRQRGMSLSFLQALGDANGNGVNCFTFLKQKLKPCHIVDGMMPGYAVDEREKQLYILLGSGKLDTYLKIFHLRYQGPDKYGYRRIEVLQEGPCVKVSNVLVSSQLSSAIYANNLTITPSTGQLVTECLSRMLDKSNMGTADFPAYVIYDQKQKTGVLKAATDHLLFNTHLQSMQMDMHHPVFSRLNHMLFWHGFHFDAFDAEARKIKPTADDDGCLILTSFNLGNAAASCHLNTVKIDPVALVKSLLLKEVFDSFLTIVPNFVPKHLFIGAHLNLLGHVHKYVVFSLTKNYILAAKWPKEWYKMSQLPPVGISKVMVIDKEGKCGQIDHVCLMDTTLYLSFELIYAQVVRRTELGHKFKDYRRCALCGKEETRKKRKGGRRMSRYKVCRICKRLNFHIFYSDPDVTCHYCSDECQRKDWKQHKIIHKTNPKERK